MRALCWHMYMFAKIETTNDGLLADLTNLCRFSRSKHSFHGYEYPFLACEAIYDTRNCQNQIRFADNVAEPAELPRWARFRFMRKTHTFLHPSIRPATSVPSKFAEIPNCPRIIENLWIASRSIITTQVHKSHALTAISPPKLGRSAEKLSKLEI